MNHCKNCNAALEASFCPQCGQKDIDLKRPLASLLGEVLRETFDVDGRALRTLLTLFRHPGVLTARFLAGRRRLYTPPFRLYLVISVLFFVVAAWIAGRGILLGHDQTVQMDAAGQARFIADELPRLMFVLLPVFALLLKFSFWHRLYFEHLIHSLHLHSAAYVVLALMLPLEQVAEHSLMLLLIQLLLFGYLLANFFVSMRRVYGGGRLVTAAKCGGIFLGYLIVLTSSFEAVSYFTMPGFAGTT